MDEINQIKNFANQTLVPIVKDDGLSFILDYIRENNVKLILEIGTAIGYSSIKFAQVNPDVRVYTIEFDIDRYQQAVKNVNKFIMGRDKGKLKIEKRLCFWQIAENGVSYLKYR